jgi:hypothetical protein
MTSSEILQQRLINIGLVDSNFKDYVEAISHLGAVQAQDFPAAKWSVGIRVKDSTDEDIMQYYNSGKILRTHIMRPTWHFVTPEDILWITELTAPNVKKLMSHYNRKLELDEKLFAKTEKAIIKVLQEKGSVTRKEFKEIFSNMSIKTDVQRLAHIVMWAELDGIICSGPMDGKQFTYSLLEARAPKAKKFSREESLAKLALKYFTSHGPAQIKDFSWWSGLSMSDANIALDYVKSKLESESIDKKVYWFKPQKGINKFNSSNAYLLSIYDEYTIAYKDRSDLSKAEKDIEKMIMMGNALNSVIVLDGKVIGSWKRKLKKNTVEIALNPFTKLKNDEMKLLKEEAFKYGKFFGVESVITP